MSLKIRFGRVFRRKFKMIFCDYEQLFKKTEKSVMGGKIHVSIFFT